MSFALHRGTAVSESNESSRRRPTAELRPGNLLRLALEILLGPVAVLSVFGLVVAGLIPIWAAAVSVGPLFLMFFLLLFLSWESLDEDSVTFPPTAFLGFAGGYVGASLGYYVLLRWIATSWPLLIQVPALAFVVLPIPFLALLLGRSRSRAWVLRSWSEFVPVGPALGLAFGVVLLTASFAAITFVFKHHDLVELSRGRPETPTVEEIATLYIWQFLQGIPLLDINDTLRWSQPLKYDDAQTGTLVLIYKLAVIVPVIGTFLTYWRREPPAAD